MSIRNFLLIVIIFVGCFFLCGCQILYADKESGVAQDSVVLGHFKEPSCTNEKLEIIEREYESVLSDDCNADLISSFNSANYNYWGFDITIEDILLYAKSSFLIQDYLEGYEALLSLGYTIGEDKVVKAQNYSQAKVYIQEGNYIGALELLNKILDYEDSREYAVEVEKHIIGSIGPAGGYIFYDKGEYSDGWRYLEAAPNDIGKFTFGEKKVGYGILIGCTSVEIGEGHANTEKIIDKLGEGRYAAKACVDYECNGYDDWFLPSRDELNLMYENLYRNGVGNFNKSLWNEYWSSSETNSYKAWYQYFSHGRYYSDLSKDCKSYVRPIRAF